MKREFWIALCLLAAFGLWTAALGVVDVASIGPEGSSVGFAGLNAFGHRLTGVHMALYTLTDWLGLVPLGVVAGFGLLGLSQWIRRRSLRKVDGDLLLLGVFYLVVLGAYMLFEVLVVNWRPVLIEGRLEPSYPSSTTMLVLCVMPTAALRLGTRNRVITPAIAVFAAFMVVGRLISGVHWFSDILGGCLLSGGLVMLYCAAAKWLARKIK